MTVSGTNLSMVRGDTEFINIVLDGYTLKEGDQIIFTVREDVESDIVLQKIVEEFPSNTANILIEHEDTAELEFGTYVYDVQMNYNGNQVRTLIKKAKLKLEEEVTY